MSQEYAAVVATVSVIPDMIAGVVVLTAGVDTQTDKEGNELEQLASREAIRRILRRGGKRQAVPGIQCRADNLGACTCRAVPEWKQGDGPHGSGRYRAHLIAGGGIFAAIWIAQ